MTARMSSTRKSALAIYKKIFDRVNEERYGMPLLELPAMLVAAKDLAVDNNHMKPEGFLINRLSWGK